MQDEARVLFEPSFDLDGAVSTVVVDDQMERRVPRKLPVDASQELQELLMPVSLVTIPDDFAPQHIQRSKQRRGPIPFLVVGIVPQRPGRPG